MLRVANLKVSYSGIAVLQGVSLKVEKGEMVALIGSNGAGKSTLLNCLSGIVPAQEGSIEFRGERIDGHAGYKIARRGLLHVPEGRRIIGDQTVFENLQLGMLAAGKRGREKKIDQVFAMFPILQERRSQQAGSLSGGQQQMLAIGRALMGAPYLLLLDEPSLGLSPAMADRVFEALGELNQGGLTMLLVEQNARRALAATTRAYVIERGQIVAAGASRDLENDPKVIEHYLGT